MIVPFLRRAEPTVDAAPTRTDPAAYGLSPAQCGAAYDAAGLSGSPRVLELQYRDSFYAGTHHDAKAFDMHGRVIGTRSGDGAKRYGHQPLLSSVAPMYVPLESRRPSAPYRVARKIVSAFTAMVFGHGRFPQPRSDDPETQDWCVALIEAAGIESLMSRARTLGGRCGSVGISWAWVDGKPRVRVHRASRVHVLAWADEDERIPSHVTEVYRERAPVVAGDRKERWQWRRRDWTTTADVVFYPAEVGGGPVTDWVIDEEASAIHGDGIAHFIWVENLPDDDDEWGLDGAPDYAETYEPQVALDMINSVTYRGAEKNLDPTLLLGIEPEDVGHATVQKGSDHAMVVGKGGTATYLELGGSSIKTGMELTTHYREQILEVAECVVPDPNTITSAGTSSVALRMLYAPMLGKTDLMRWQYGRALTQLLVGLTEAARQRLSADEVGTAAPEAQSSDELPIDVEVEEVAVPVEAPVELVVDLPPRIVIEHVTDEGGVPTGETRRTLVARKPGVGRIWLEWGPYFRPTAADEQAESQALGAASGGRPLMSQQSAVERFANARDLDGAEEWARVQREAAAAAAREAAATAGMFPPIGGGDLAAQVDAAMSSDVELPPEGELAPAQASPGAGAAMLTPAGTRLELGVSAVEMITTINEQRHANGMGPLMLADGTPDPIGFLTIAAAREAAKKGKP